jgi:hypothetical protein
MSWSKRQARVLLRNGASGRCEHAGGADAFKWISAGVGPSPLPSLAVVQPDSGSNEVLTHCAGMDAEMDTDCSERLANSVQLSCFFNIQRFQCGVATPCSSPVHMVQHR